MIPYTKPFLPPIEEYQQYLPGIWERNWVTNMGPLVKKLEKELQDYLQVGSVIYVANATLALQLSIRAMDIRGEVITTPFSFVATTSSIVWEHCTPVFADIDPYTFNVSTQSIRNVITSRTSAILITHIFGNPCDVSAIEALAKEYNLKLIYDGAHAFGVKINGVSIFNFGDVSVCSLHATKIYHSIEGGLIFTKDEALAAKLRLMQNFGFNGPGNFATLGINAKNSEFHAAMGLINLKYIQDVFDKRKQIAGWYDKLLANCDIEKQAWHVQASCKYQYYPILFKREADLQTCVEAMEENEIFPRRYFYPSLTNSLPYIIAVEMKVSDDISKRILCLPLFYEMQIDDVRKVCQYITDHTK